jgi:hypothetical protein
MNGAVNRAPAARTAARRRRQQRPAPASCAAATMTTQERRGAAARPQRQGLPSSPARAEKKPAPVARAGDTKVDHPIGRGDRRRWCADRAAPSIVGRTCARYDLLTVPDAEGDRFARYDELILRPAKFVAPHALCCRGERLRFICVAVDPEPIANEAFDANGQQASRHRTARGEARSHCRTIKLPGGLNWQDVRHLIALAAARQTALRRSKSSFRPSPSLAAAIIPLPDNRSAIADGAEGRNHKASGKGRGG